MANLTPKKKKDAMPELIAKHRGNLSAIARQLKIPRSSLHVQVQADPDLKQLLADERESMIDNAEEGLNSAVDKGEAWAVCFTLKTQGKERGYVEKSQIENSGTIEHDIKGEITVKIDQIYGK